MAIAFVLPANGASQSNTNATSYNTGSITFTSGSLRFAAITNRQTTSVASPTIANFTQIDTEAFNSAATPLERVTLFRSTDNSDGVQTIDFGGVTQANCQWIFFEATGAVVTGTDGADAIVQIVSNQDNTNAGSGQTVALAAFASANNYALGVLGYAAASGQSVAPANSFNEISEQGASGAEIGRVQAQYKANDTSVQWTTTNTSAVAWIAVEVAAAAVAAKGPIFDARRLSGGGILAGRLAG